MNAITINNAITNFPKLVADTIRNFEETIIVSDQGSVVLISQTDWERIIETLRLLRDKQSLKALIEGHKIRRKKQKHQGKTIEEAFF
ncbi:MAG: type II toxin-antitoxin system Phd/YefM family antitoxin [Bacteroidia bacterium]|nr:type II toxin-antitoxin system Phd/YefM family antitoxin [Bacteroidia bacterium]